MFVWCQDTSKREINRNQIDSKTVIRRGNPYKSGRHRITASDFFVIQYWWSAHLYQDFGNQTETHRNTQKHSKEGRQTTPYNYDGGDPDHHPPPLPMVTSKCEALGTNIRIINPERLQRFEDHEGAVTDVSWSHTNFFISGSLDKTVRLWHPSRRVCFSVFKYSDPVTSKISIRWRIGTLFRVGMLNNSVFGM